MGRGKLFLISFLLFPAQFASALQSLESESDGDIEDDEESAFSVVTERAIQAIHLLPLDPVSRLLFVRRKLREHLSFLHGRIRHFNSCSGYMSDPIPMNEARPRSALECRHFRRSTIHISLIRTAKRGTRQLNDWLHLLQQKPNSMDSESLAQIYLYSLLFLSDFELRARAAD